MESITISWDPATGAEPSNIFDEFIGRVFALGFDDGSEVQIVWDAMVSTDDGMQIIGLHHDPVTGRVGETVQIALGPVRSVRYL